MLEAAHYGYLLTPDARSANSAAFVNPLYFNNGGDTRQRYSLGTEFRLPVLNWLTWTTSACLDKYRDASRADAGHNRGAGIEWRPYDGLPIRGTYGTNFNAPDMQAIYITGSTSPLGDNTDPLRCIDDIKTGMNNSTWCPNVQRPQSKYHTLHTSGSRVPLPQAGHS